MSRRTRRHSDTLSMSDAFYELKADFRAGEDSRFHSRLRGVASAGSGADYHYRSESRWLHMLERARHYRREDQVVGQAIRRLTANVVQDGFNLDVQTGDDGVNAALKARWWDWAEDADQCHSEQELTFHALERLTLESRLVDGDVLHLPLRDGSLQPVEAHRLRTPTNTQRNVVHGVLMDNRARRKEYWITKEDLGTTGALTRVSEIQAYAARDAEGHRQVFHIYDPYRFSQRRGITALAPISFTVGAHDDLQFASLVKAQMGALIAILRERGDNWEPGADAQAGPRTTETDPATGYTRTIEGLAAGLEVASDKGEKISMFAANVPGAEFREHSQLILTFIAINLDLPVSVLLLDPSDTNFSGWRGAIDQARLRWRQMQRDLATSFHTPVYRWKVRQWLAQDAALRRLSESGKINPFAHEWHPPRWPYIEPLKDAAADELRDAKLLSSKRRIHSDRGVDWEDLAPEIVADNVLIIRQAIEAADALNADFPKAKVDWREVLRVPTADTVSATLALKDAAQTPAAPQKVA